MAYDAKDPDTIKAVKAAVAPPAPQAPVAPKENAVAPVDYPLVLLRFFRDLNDAQRLAILVKLGALPTDWSQTSSHALERQIVDALVLGGRIEELKLAIEEQRVQNGQKGIAT